MCVCVSSGHFYLNLVLVRMLRNPDVAVLGSHTLDSLNMHFINGGNIR